MAHVDKDALLRIVRSGPLSELALLLELDIENRPLGPIEEDRLGETEDVELVGWDKQHRKSVIEGDQRRVRWRTRQAKQQAVGRLRLTCGGVVRILNLKIRISQDQVTGQEKERG